jgi:hypothetical protein
MEVVVKIPCSCFSIPAGNYFTDLQVVWWASWKVYTGTENLDPTGLESWTLQPVVSPCTHWAMLYAQFHNYHYIIIIIIISESAVQRGLWPPRERGFLSHITTRHSR